MISLGIIEEPELRTAGAEVLPVSGIAFCGEDRTGRHIVETRGSEGIDEGRNAGIMGEDRHGVVLVVEIVDHGFEDGWCGMVELGDEADILSLYIELMGEKLRGLAGSFCRTRYEAVDPDAGLYQAFGHVGGIPFSSVIQRLVEIAHRGVVPAALRMPDDQ